MGRTGRECHHCRQWIEAGEAHDCWTTTEAALTADLSEDLREAWERLRETAADFGDQRIYASGTAIMFSRKSCYFFVRPRRNDLQVCIFLGLAVRSPLVRRVERKSTSKLANTSTSPTGTKSSRRSPTGCAKPTICRTHWSRAVPETRSARSPG